MRYLFLIFLYPLTVLANLEVAVTSVESTDRKSLVKLEARNTFDQGIKGARAWVFLMDDEGTVVGNQAQWIIGGDSAQQEVFAADESQKFSVVVDVVAKPTQTKITFSRLILEDGSLVDPRERVVPLEDAK